MGVGSKKEAIVKPLSEHVFCGVRLGGMGVAIISTSNGVMSDRSARAAGHGGEVLCTVE